MKTLILLLFIPVRVFCQVDTVESSADYKILVNKEYFFDYNVNKDAYIRNVLNKEPNRAFKSPLLRSVYVPPYLPPSNYYFLFYDEVKIVYIEKPYTPYVQEESEDFLVTTKDGREIIINGESPEDKIHPLTLCKIKTIAFKLCAPTH